MKIVVLAALLFLVVGCNADHNYDPQDGDIIFQTSRSTQSTAIQLATGSRYSHMGVVYLNDEIPFVFEAVEPVKTTPLAEWIARGEDGHFVVKRLVDARKVLTPEALEKMLAVGRTFEDKHYDLTFEWSDEKIYCSELVWKIYQRALGLEIGELETMADFDLSSPAVQAKLKERWGEALPLDELVISPVAMFESELLVEVHQE